LAASSREKGVDVAIRAFARALEEVPDAQFVLIGLTSPEIGAATRRLRHDHCDYRRT
jgi:glycosyltransferase involved in cell wall biosynthesis